MMSASGRLDALLRANSPITNALPLYELAGGGLGAAAFTTFIVLAKRHLGVASWALTMAPFVLVAFAGLLLLTRSRGGIWLSACAQALQMAFWAVPGSSWNFVRAPSRQSG